MIKSYFKAAWRNTAGNVSYSSINIFGLAAGLSSFIIILLYLNYELSYDKWSPDLEKVVRVSMRTNEDYLPQTPAPLASFIAGNYNDAEAATSIQSAGDYQVLLTANDKKIYQKNIVTADASFFKVFPYKLTKGDASTVLNQPRAVVLTEQLSYKLFGDADPVGKPIKLYNAIDGVVAGVMQEPAGPSHLTVSLVISNPYGKQNMMWENYSYQTYLKLKYSKSVADVEDGLNQVFYNGHLKKDNKTFEAYKKAGQQTALLVDKVPDIHNFPKHGSSNFTTVSILLILAVLLLLAGAINFSNLAIAKSMARAKEVGVRKVLGSSRIQLVGQFMAETALQCFISLVIAVVIIYFAVPYINQSFNLALGFGRQANNGYISLQILGCLLIIILLSGLYPSLFLSKFNASKVLKGDYSSGKKGMLFRNSLVVVQFMVSVFFIIATLVIRSQMNYMQDRDKGFSGEQVMRIEAKQSTRDNDFAKVTGMLMSVPGVSSVAKTTKVPGDNLFIDTNTYNFKYEGKGYRMASVKISKDYFKTLRVSLAKGRMFTDGLSDQNTRTAIINQSAAKILHISDVAGQTITFPYCDSIPMQIVGVVKDFNVQGFEREVQPEVYTIGNKACMFQSGGAILIKLKSNHMQQSIANIEGVWKNIEPDFPIRYSFLDDNFQQLFVSYVRLQKIISFFAFIAILISVMGLFALTAFFTRQRTKEIGVRKVLGATVTQLAALLSKEFIYLVLISIVFITPIAWWFMQKWLQTFAYRINLSWGLFIVGGLSAMLIAVLTVSFQAIKAALTNPAKILRSE